MSRVLISKRAELDTITMQRRPNYYHYHKKMLLKIAKRSILQRQQRPDVAGWVINRSVQQQNMTQFHSSACVALHCKQYVPLIANRTEGTLFMVPASTHTQRTFHTATSPSGTDSHVLFSTRWGKFTSQDDARRQVARLSAEERGHLEKAIKDLKERSEETQSEPPSWNQLKLCKAVQYNKLCDYMYFLFLFIVCYQNALPFIGFGFLDNVIMISVVRRESL